MKIKAKVSFTGAITMGKGEERECENKTLISDLLRAGYVEEIKRTGGQKEQKSQRAVKK